MNKKLIVILITSFILCLMIPSVALAAQETADFEDLGYGDDGHIPISTSIDGFVFTDSGADVDMIYSTNLGEDSSSCVHPDYTEFVTLLSIKRADDSDFKLISMWLDEAGVAACNFVDIAGYNNNIPVPGCVESSINVIDATTVSLNWVADIDEIRITPTFDSCIVACIDTIVYELPDTAPTVDTNTGISLNEGATTTIEDTHLLSSDDNDGDNDITYTITDLPDNGVLKNNGSTLPLNSTFTQADINNNRITYVHDDGNTTSDSFTFKVADSIPNELTGKTFDITVNEVDDDAPTITTNKKLTLNEGTTSTINDSLLLADDTDTNNDTLIFTITSAPSHGHLENSIDPDNAISSFAQPNLIARRIQYVHDGTNTTSDSFTFKVSDPAGNELTDQTFNIEITPVDDDIPYISINNGYPDPGGPTDPLLYEGGTCSIDTEHLAAEDTDSDDDSLIFIITSSPSNGQVENTDNTDNPISSFTQQNIIDGKIKYVHDGSNTTSDSFIFKVSDGTNELIMQTFDLTITAVNDDTPTIATNNGLPDYPSTSPVQFYTGNTMCIPIDLLEANDEDTDNATLTFTITSAPSHGRIENSDNVGTPISSFTQQNIIDGKIQYAHDGGSSSADSFIFKVSDGTNELTGQTFNITITVSVGSVIFDNSEVTMNVGVTDTLVTTFPYTITPSNAVNKNVTFTSSNPAVATVNNTTGMVQAMAPGVTKITVTSDEKPTIKDECILKVADTTPPPADAKGGAIGGKLIDNSGNPLAEYRVTLCSTPITVITNSAGEFQFPATTFSNHILIVNDPAMHEITRFALGFTQGTSTNTLINNTTNTIDITYTNSTATINVDLQSNLAGDDISANDVAFVANSTAYAESKVINPETGDRTLPYGMIACVISLIILASIGYVFKNEKSKGRYKGL